MRTLLVMRHAKSDWQAANEADHDRPLNKRGARTARLVGRLLAERGETPDHIVSSTALRAQTTAELAIQTGNWDCSLALSSALYGAWNEAVLSVIADAPDVDRLMIVGHEPAWSRVVTQLTGSSVEMKTGSVAIIELPIESWTEISDALGSLQELINPRNLFGSRWDDNEGLSLPEGSWVVSEISIGGELVPPLEGPVLTLEVSGGRLSGSAGINRFMGQIDKDHFGTLATTRMAGPPELMDQEARYLRHLSSIDRVEVTKKGMNMVTSGLVVLTLTSMNQSNGERSSG